MHEVPGPLDTAKQLYSPGAVPDSFVFLAPMEDDFRHTFQVAGSDRETTMRMRRIAYPGSIVYQMNLAGDDPFRMRQNTVGQWEFEDRLHCPMVALDIESELIRVIRENEG